MLDERVAQSKHLCDLLKPFQGGIRKNLYDSHPVSEIPRGHSCCATLIQYNNLPTMPETLAWYNILKNMATHIGDADNEDGDNDDPDDLTRMMVLLVMTMMMMMCTSAHPAPPWGHGHPYWPAWGHRVHLQQHGGVAEKKA